MKRLLPLFIFLLVNVCTYAQLTTAIPKAGFGVDADVNANFYNNMNNTVAGFDDWFARTSGTLVIDTTGAYALKTRATSDANYRKLPFFRTMRVPQLSRVNNRLWLDAIYIRDYSGQNQRDSTAFATSNKNGMSPAAWIGEPSQVNDKNDISDMLLHVRRAGLNATDSLWLMGGLSIQGTGGQRYFDFELYQTDIFYNRATSSFSGYGPDAGHTSWKFDASGNIIAPGDIILSAEYQSSFLSNVEARIWVDRSALTMTPASFSWVTDGNGNPIFDGANNSSQYGYAAIKPNTVGWYYTGLDNRFATWAGPFGFVNGSNVVVNDFAVGQFMEFSVNLTKIGLDPMTLLTGGTCDLPFRKILVKTRTSNSFTASLTDFIGPFDFFLTPPVDASTNVPMYCGTYGVSDLMVTNALEASVYTWRTLDGRFTGDSVGPRVTVDQPGTYIVTQQLMDGCSAYASDTVVIRYDAACTTLNSNILNFSGSVAQGQVQLKWATAANNLTEHFIVQRSADGQRFDDVATVPVRNRDKSTEQYKMVQDIDGTFPPVVYYRLYIVGTDNKAHYSHTVRLNVQPENAGVRLYPNPATDFVQVYVQSERSKKVTVNIYDMSGKKMYASDRSLTKGLNVITINHIARWQKGVYLVNVNGETGAQWQKLFVGNSQPLK
jgi:hypothetical protein